MKIGFIVPFNGISGGLYVVYKHAHYLAEKGHSVEIIIVSEQLGLTVTCFPEFSLKTLSLTEAIEAGTQYDVLIATWWETFYQMFQLESCHYLYFCQSDERKFYAQAASFELPFVELTYKDKDVGIITMARWIQHWLKKSYDIRAEYAPNGIYIQIFHPDVKPNEEKKDRLRVLIEGPGSIPFKQVDLAFRVTNRIPDIEVWLVSTDGVVKKEWRYDRFFSRVPLETMPSIYRSCDILLKLASFESFGYPPLEMMSCGGTAVVTKTNGWDEYLEHEKNALLVEINNEPEAFAALNRLIHDDDLRKRLSEEGIKTARRMNWKDRSPFFEQAVLNLVQRGSIIHQKHLYRIIDQLRSSRNSLSQRQEAIHQEFDERTALLDARTAQLADALQRLDNELHDWRPFKTWKKLRSIFMD